MDMAEIRAGCGACRDASPLGFAFTMAFQPVVDLHERRIDAHEALVRGVDGEGAGQILAQVNTENRYKFDQACRVKAIEMASRLAMACTLNINFLPNAVYEPAACIRSTLEAAARTGFPLERITFEIVEQEDVAEAAHLRRIISEYRRNGFKVALDDFGTGYSGLARLAELKPDIVKLDRFLIKDCDQDTTRLAIVTSMIALCRALGIKIVIEGVETKAEVAALQSAGARFMQGFFFARPAFEALVPASAITWP
jgi:EAL domain-containing protein (putative c-di-GMP-specific phosphodiesterase class I)